MEATISDKKEVLQNIEAVAADFNTLMAPLTENQVNQIPYEGSWTAGQLFRHVAKSVNGMAQALLKPGKTTERDAGERIPELKKTFLDFKLKMKSPDMIVPEDKHYEKQAIADELNNAFNSFKKNADKVNVNELVEGLPLGPVTKLEIIHFTLYHSQRHLHQFRKICAAIV